MTANSGDNLSPGSQPAPSDPRWQENRRHWEATLDAHNLKDDARPTDVARDVALFETADVRYALDQLEPLNGKLAMDLGGGLGLGAILLARRGAHPLVCDLSRPRLQEARKSLKGQGLGQNVYFVVAAAEHLPFADGSIDRLFVKSVLIHTRLTEASRECGRVLAADARAAVIEPMRRHPLVNLYRRLAAPRIWQSITTYFSPQEFETVRRGLEEGRAEEGQTTVRPFFLLGFLASVFAFAVPAPKVYRAAEAVAGVFDRTLMAVAPVLGRFAWFGVLVHKRGDH